MLLVSQALRSEVIVRPPRAAVHHRPGLGMSFAMQGRWYPLAALDLPCLV